MKRWVWANRHRIMALLGLGGVWVMDVANTLGPGERLTNGFWEVDRVQGFHLAMLMVVIALVAGILARPGE